MTIQDESSRNVLPSVEVENHDNKTHLKYKVLKSLLLMEIWFSMGVNIAVNTPSLIDLSELMGVNIEEMSMCCFVARSIGMLLGGPIGGIVADKNRKHLDLLLALSVGLMCVSTAVVPLVPWFAAAALLFTISGFTFASLSASGNPLILSMWGKRAAAPLQFIHGGYGIGLTITPLFTAPFLSKNITSNTTLLTSATMNSTLDYFAFESYRVGLVNGSHSRNGLRTVSRIYIPFAVSGVLGMLGSLGMLIFYFHKIPTGEESTHREPSSWRQVVHPSTYSPGRPLFGALMAFGLYLMYLGINGKDRSINSFITTYAVQQLNVSKSTASIMTTGYFASYTLGRYVSMLVAFCVPVYISMFVTIIADFGLSLILVLIGLYKKTDYWILTYLFGFFAGPIYPLGMAWADQYITVTPVVVAIIDLGISSGFMLCIGIGSYLYEYVNHIYIIENVMYFGAFLFLITVLLQILGYKYGMRQREVNVTEVPEERLNRPCDYNVIISQEGDEHTPLIN